MQCKSCELWVHREIPGTKKKKEFFPTGICCNIAFAGQQWKLPTMTVGETNCDRGTPKKWKQ